MSFFIRNNSGKQKPKKKLVKNRKSAGDANRARNKKKEEKFNDDDEILSDEIASGPDEDEVLGDNQKQIKHKLSKKRDIEDLVDNDDSDNELETPQEKKIRLAKKYLSELEDKFEEEKSEDEKDDEGHRSDRIAAHLKDSVLEKAGQLHRKVADDFKDEWQNLNPSSSEVVILKNGHRKSLTCCIISNDTRFVFTASKECSIIKWCRETGRRLRTAFGNHRQDPEKFAGHTGSISTLAISTDDKFLASGGVNKVIHIWRPEDMSHLHTFRGHRGSITGLAFRKSFHQLFSSSEDRMVKVWNLDEMSYVESLFGHHDTITSIDSFVRERALTSGGRDATIRLWKIPEESHLIYLTKGEATIDLVKFIDEGHFLSAADNGTISLWALAKKKPTVSINDSHGQGNWVSAIASLRNTDLLASGSKNGKIIFWKICNDFRSLQPLFEYPVTGFVNSLEFSADGRFLIAAIGQEHRLGRWWRIKEARNVVHIIPLKGIV